MPVASFHGETPSKPESSISGKHYSVDTRNPQKITTVQKPFNSPMLIDSVVSSLIISPTTEYENQMAIEDGTGALEAS